MITTVEKYEGVLMVIRNKLDPFEPKALGWATIQRDHGVGTQLLICLLDAGKLTRHGRDQYTADPSLWQMKGQDLQRLTSEFYKAIRNPN
jgi:hypothetical protein